MNAIDVEIREPVRKACDCNKIRMMLKFFVAKMKIGESNCSNTIHNNQSFCSMRRERKT